MNKDQRFLSTYRVPGLRWAILGLVLLSALQLQAQTKYVTPGGAGTKTGGSWANAYDSTALQGSTLSSAGSGTVFWVKAGTYHPNLSSSANNILIPSGVAVYGGFAGTETLLTQRNVSTNVTILDGHSTNLVIEFVNASSSTMLDGFTISNGYAANGGGINNSASGTGSASSPTIANCTFINNNGYDDGGAIYNIGSNSATANPTITNCTFKFNKAYNGGAIANFSYYSGIASPVITQCTFRANKTTSSYSGGGAIYNDGSLSGNSNPVIRQCTFTNDSTAGYGGAITNNVNNSGNANPVITNCVFTSNYAGYGGGAINNSTSGGTCDPTITNCIFYANIGQSGGAIYCVGGTSTGQSNPLFTNCTFSRNYASSQGGLGYFDTYLSGTCTPVFKNCILWRDTGNYGTNELYTYSSSPAIYYSDIKGGWSGTGSNNINTDPKFVSTSDLKLWPNSPCVQTGNVSYLPTGDTTDVLGNVRTAASGTKVDMGAYQHITCSSVTPITTSATICQGTSYTFKGKAYTTAGIYYDTVINSNGCDSILYSLALTVKNIPTATITSTAANVCSGNSTIISGTVNAVGTWTVTLSDSSTITGTGTTFSRTFTPSITKYYTVKSVTDSTGCTAAAVPSSTLSYTLYSIDGGTGDTSQYSPYARSASDFVTIFDTTKSNTTVYHRGTDTARALLYFNGSFVTSVPNGGLYFGVQITGTFVAKETGTYSFGIDGDDAVDFSLNGTVITSEYGVHGFTGLKYGTVNLVAGNAYTFRVREQQYLGGYGLSLVWKRPSQSTYSIQPNEIMPAGVAINVISTHTTLNITTCAGQPYTIYDYDGVSHPQTFDSSGTYTVHPASKFGCDSTITLNLTVLPAVYHVTMGGAGTKSGTSWTNALDSAAFRTKVATVCSGTTFWLAAGTYHPNLSSSSNTFAIASGVAVYGGFAGTETLLSQRNIATNVTTLDGHKTNTVVSFNQASSSTILDGFTITHGSSINGAGINNTGGSAGSTPSVANCIFIYNNATGNGGAIYNYKNSTGATNGTFTNCTFKFNKAPNGGAVYTNGNPTFYACTFSGNKASSSGGAVYNDGSSSKIANPVFVYCTFTNDTASALGGAFYNDAVGSGTGNPVINGCTFASNIAGLRGGALYNDGYINGTANAQVSNTIFYANRSTGGNGGAVINDGDAGHSNVVYTNCTFTRNKSNATGGAAYNTGSGGSCKPVFNNCIIWNDSTGSSGNEIADNNSTTTLHNTDIKGGWSGTGSSNINTNPKFVSTTNVRLYPNSPCLLTGNVTYLPTGDTTDILGNVRTVSSGTEVDMGAYQHVSCGTSTSVSANVYICAGTSYTFNGHSYSTAGSYIDTVVNSNGCDSILYTHVLTVNSAPTATITSGTGNVCPGSSTVISGIVKAGGAWTVTLSDSSTASGIAGDTTFSITVTPSATKAYIIKSVSDTTSCTLASSNTSKLYYTIYSTHAGNGSTSQYSAGANSAADFVAMFDTANSNTTIYHKGSDSARALLYYSNTFDTTTPNGGSYFGVLMTGTFIPKETGTYSFGVDGDDAVDFSLNDSVIASEYGLHGFSGNQYGSIYLTAGRPYTFKAREQQYGGGYGFSLVWKRPSQSTYSIQPDEIVNATTVNVINTKTTLNIVLCAGHSYTIYDYDGVSHPQRFDSTGTYTVKPASKFGCDSTIKLHLTVRRPLYYVTMGGAGTKDGSTWANAMDSTTFRDTLPTFCSGTAFWVKAGTYHPNLSNSNATLAIPSGVSVYGGFAGTETMLSQRNISTHVTKLDGNLTNTVVSFDHVSSSTTLDGFTISNGLGNYAGGVYNNGNTSDSSKPVIANCTFNNNTSFYGSGAIYNDGTTGGNASPTITHCAFNNNYSYYYGGAIYNYGDNGYSSPVITYCTFNNNNCIYSTGGAIFNSGNNAGKCTPTISHCSFTHNTSGYFGGAIYNFGQSGTCSTSITNDTFTGNKAASNGGAIFNDGSYNSYYGGICKTTITQCLFTSDTAAGNGGAIYNNGSNAGSDSAIITQCVFNNNISTGNFAGAVYNDGTYGGICSPVFTSCQFNYNKAILWGGAVMNDASNSGIAKPKFTYCSFTGNSAPTRGGAMDNDGYSGGNCAPTILNCTFSYDTSGIGAAIFNDAAAGTSADTIINSVFTYNVSNDGILYNFGISGGNASGVVTNATFTLNTSVCIINNTSSSVFNNCIVWNNGGTAIADSNGAASTVNYSDITGGWSGTGTSNIDTTPQFVNTTNYSLKIKSPCALTGSVAYITAGDSTDVLGNPRTAGGGTLIDMGAYQHLPCGAVTPIVHNVYICQGDSFMHNGITYKTATTLYDTLRYQTGCDSIINSTVLIINIAPTAVITSPAAYICPGNSTVIKGIVKAKGAWSLTLNDSSTASGTAADTTFSITVTTSATRYYAVRLVTDTTGCTALPALNKLQYTLFSTHGGNGSTNQYGAFAGNASDFVNIFDTANYNTTIYHRGADTAGNLLYFNNTFDTTVPNGGYYFGVLITGSFVPKETGMYSFGVDGDDAVDFSLNGKVVTSNYGTHGFTGYQYDSIYLVAGRAYAFMAREQQYQGGYGFSLVWKRPSQTTYAIHSDEIGPIGVSVNVINTTTTVNANICHGQSYIIYDYDGVSHPRSYNATGTYTVRPASKFGCDSVITLNLTVLKTQYYVTMGGAGSKDGSTWANAMDSTTFRTVLPAYCSGTAFWVAAGTYHPDLSSSSNTLAIPSGVAAYGGFAGTETLLSQRNATTNVTILDGNYTNTIVSFDHASPSTTLDGFTLTHGHTRGNGGAIYNNGNTQDSSNPVIAHCIFTYNISRGNGSAIYNDGSSSGQANPSISHCTFTHDSANGSSVIYNNGSTGTCNPVITSCTFTANTSNNWGSVMNNNGEHGNSSPVITGCIITGNTSNDNATIANDGQYGNSSPVITNCTFANNKVAYSGGAIYNLAENGTTNPVITNCAFIGNRAMSGGALFNNGFISTSCSPTYTNCTFTGDSASGSGGVAYSVCYGGTCSMTYNNCILWKNVAPFDAELDEIGNASILNNTDIYGGWSGTGKNNINADPQFTSATVATLKSISPCINAGNNSYIPTGITKDLAGNTRIQKDVVDMGVYESPFCPTLNISLSPASSTICSGSSQMFTISGIGSGVSVAWQYNVNPTGTSSTWTGFGTANADTATLNGITHTEYVRAILTGTPSCLGTSSSYDAYVKIDSASVLSYSNVTSTSVALSWTPVLGASTYTIHFGADSVSTSSTSYTLTGLTACTTYSIYVSHNASACGSGNTNTVSITTLPASIVLRLDTIAGHKIKAHWNGVKGNRYKLYIGTIVSLPNTSVFTTKDTTYTVSAYYPGQTVFAYVVLDSGSTCSTKPVSSTQYVNINGGACSTAAPNNLIGVSTSNSISLSWHGSSSYYEVYYKALGSRSWTAYKTGSASYTINSLKPGTCYVMFVANICSVTPTRFGYTSAFDTVCTQNICGSPVNLVLSNATCHGFLGSWNAIAGSSYYNAYFTHITGSGTVITYSYRYNTNHFTINTLAPGTLTTVYIKATCTSGGLSSTSNQESITTLTTGCKEDGDIQSGITSLQINIFNVYPNPNNGQFTVNLISPDVITPGIVQVIDILGQVVTQATIENDNGLINTTLNCNQLAPGVYFVKLFIGNESHVARIVIQR